MAGDVDALCRLLVQPARERQGCGTNSADIGPLLRLAIDSEADVTMQRIVGRQATMTIPSAARPAAGIAKGTGQPQLLRLRYTMAGWRFEELRLRQSR